MRGFPGLVALALAHVARSEVFVSNFTELENAIADGAAIRIAASSEQSTTRARRRLQRPPAPSISELSLQVPPFGLPF